MRIATSELAASAGMAIKNEARPISDSSAVHASVVRRVTRPSGATLAERSAVLRADSVGGLGYRRRSSAPRTSKTTLGYARAAAVAPRVASGPSRDSREADTQRSAESRVPRADGAESGPTPRCLRGSKRVTCAWRAAALRTAPSRRRRRSPVAVARDWSRSIRPLCLMYIYRLQIADLLADHFYRSLRKV